VEVGFGGVFVLCPPQLLFIPDTNRDDIPDGPPQVLLNGFAEGVVGHNIANGLKWGPDGWLYGRHGIQETSLIGPPAATESQRAKINTGIWRYHPVHRKVEAVMHGMTNSWGFDYDQHGEMFCINTVIGHLWHVVPGARTERMYGIDFNPHAYQLIKQCADHVHWDTGELWHQVQKGISSTTDAAGGGHAHSGLLIYQGDNWPKEYRHKAYTLNMHGRRINCDRIEPYLAGFVAKHEPDFAHFADPWFRGIDLIAGPDGGVYIADWSDTGECHDHDGVHRTSGRIYKLTYGKPTPTQRVDLRAMPLLDLADLLASGNTWLKRAASLELSYRMQEAKSPLPSDLLSFEVANGGEQNLVHVIRMTMNLAAQESLSLPQEFCDELVQMAQNDPAGLTCLYLAAALQQMEVDHRWTLAEQLAARKEFSDDRMFPIMLWLGIESAVTQSPHKAVALAQLSHIPLLTQNLARRLTLEIERDPKTVTKLLDVAIGTECAHPHEIILGMSHALNGWRKAPAPANWSQAAQKFSASDLTEVKQAVQQLSIVFGDGVALDTLSQLATNGGAQPEARRQALRALLASKPTGFAATLHGLLGDRAVAVEVLRGLALYDDPSTPEKILAALGIYPPDARAEAVNTLATRPEYARALLEAVKQGGFNRNEITAYHARQITAFGQPELSKELAEVWGEVRTTAAEKRALIEAWKHKLPTSVLVQANLPAGRALFQKSCVNCHVLYGVGRKVGPDLTGSNRANLDYLLENILDPSASVAADFRAVNIALDDGRVLNGVLSAQTERTITLQTDRDAITIDREEIDELQPTPNSLMPDGLLTTFTDEQVRDLVGYLMSPQQVPLPE
jgi:putative membrane-bound dehydrogenase-like protein